MRLRDLAKTTLAALGYKLQRTRPRRSEADTRQTTVSPLGDVDDIVYRVGDWRYEARMEDLVGRSCFGYGRSSWHPYVEAASELLGSPPKSHVDSVLARFFDSWQPRNVQESHFPADESTDSNLTAIPARSLFEPWIKRPGPCADPRDPACSPAGSPLFGPIPDRHLAHEFDRLGKMLRSVQRYGYDPDGFPRGLIKVVVLRHSGNTRLLVAHGQHRAAILSALGVDRIQVGIFEGLPPLIDSAHVRDWPHVRSGLIAADVATRFVARFFEPELSGHAGSVRSLLR